MSPATTFATAAAFAAALAGALATGAAPAVADDSQLFGVKAIDVRLSGATPALTVRNVAANHNLDSLQLAVQGSKVSVAVSGYVDCTGIQVENLAKREGHFLSGGAFGIGRCGVNSTVVGEYQTTPGRKARHGAAKHKLVVLQLAVRGSYVSVAVSGDVDCTGIQVGNWGKREGQVLSGGAFGIGRTSLRTGEELPDSSDIDQVSDM